MSWFWIIILLTCAYSSNSSEAYKQQYHKKSSSAVVVGTVYCDKCFQQDIPKASHFIAGASVAVECKDTTKSNPSFRQEVKTDSHGEFKVHLPFPVSSKLHHVKKIIKACSVKLITSNMYKPNCSIAAATATSSNLHLTLLCDQKPDTADTIHINNLNTEKLSPITNPNDPTFLPPVQDTQPSLLPPLPQLPQLPPLPELPSLPPLPKFPFLPPIPKQETGLSDNDNNNNNNNAVNQPGLFPFPPNPFNPPSVFPPNPFQPPPSLFPPVFPSPPAPSILPPLFPTPSPPPFFQLPPIPRIPGLMPSPPPPPPPPLVFPIPLPPFPFQPTPGFPGVPPAEVSSPLKTSSP